MIKKKQLVAERQIALVWQHFLGQDYEVVTGQFVSRSSDESIIKIVDDFILDNNGVLFVEYTHKETGKKSTLLQGEWFVQLEDVIQHMTPYILEHLTTFYDEKLNLIVREEEQQEESSEESNEVSGPGV